MQLQVENVSETSDFDRIAQRGVNRIDAVGDINYAALHRELQSMQGPVEFIFSPDALAQEMARVQGYKDRAVEILGKLAESHIIQKHVVEVLTKGWTRFSEQKSAEKREGEAMLKLSQFSMSAADAEYEYKHAMGIVKNLESQLESLSRQIACIQIAAKIHDPRFAYDSSFVDGSGTRDVPTENEDRVTDWEKLDG